MHRTRRGWLYNVAGYDAVLIRRSDGTSLLLGSDEPRRLKSAIERAAGADLTDGVRPDKKTLPAAD